MAHDLPAPTTLPPNGTWPRQADIARVAGVSQATVSMVINDPSASRFSISAPTRERVWTAVEQLSYTTNSAARVLAGGRSRTLGVFTFEPAFPTTSPDFYLPFLQGIEEESERQDHDLLLFTSGSGSDRTRSIYRNGANRLRSADGCIMLGLGGDDTELERLAREPLPVVYIGRRVIPDADVAYIGADYAGATARVVSLLMDAGHRRIAYLGRTQDDVPTRDRYRGYLTAHEEEGRRPDPGALHLRDDADPAEILRAILDSRASAVIVQDGAAATAVATAAQAAGLHVPRDLSIAVLGDPSSADERDWTGFEIPRTQMGEQAVRMLVSMLDARGGPLPQRLLECSIHPGSTIGPAPSES